MNYIYIYTFYTIIISPIPGERKLGMYFSYYGNTARKYLQSCDCKTCKGTYNPLWNTGCNFVGSMVAFGAWQTTASLEEQAHAFIAMAYRVTQVRKHGHVLIGWAITTGNLGHIIVEAYRAPEDITLHIARLFNIKPDTERRTPYYTKLAQQQLGVGFDRRKANDPVESWEDDGTCYTDSNMLCPCQHYSPLRTALDHLNGLRQHSGDDDNSDNGDEGHNH